MKISKFIKTGLAALIAMSIANTSAAGKVDYTKMSAEELAEYLVFDAKGFKLDQKTQEGGTIRDRHKQDEIQKLCSAIKGNPVDSKTANKVTALAKKSIVYPKGGIKLGDWKKGRALVTNAYGFRVGHKTDNHKKKTPGGMCINCHSLDSKLKVPAGNVGPSLTGFGKQRGNSKATQKYVYDLIYNPHSVFPCTNMPRLGANNFISKEKISHIMAYILDPKSPVNK